MMLAVALLCAAALLALAPIAVLIARTAKAARIVYGLCAAAAVVSLFTALKQLLGAAPAESLALPLGIPWVGTHFRIELAVCFLPRGRRSWRRYREPVRHGLRQP